MRIILIIILLSFSALCYGADADGVVRNIETVLNDVWNDTLNSLTVDSGAMGASIVSFSRDVATAGTAVQLSTDSTACREITIYANPDNIGRIYVGNVAVSSLTGVVLSKDVVHTVVIKTDNAQDIYLDAEHSGESCQWIGIVR